MSDAAESEAASGGHGSAGRRIGFFLGPAVFALLLLLPAPEGLQPAAWRVAAVTALMAVWWITEAIPIPATALLPIALFPLLGVMPSKEATPAYADHLIYLFMGGFFLAVTMERWNLHRRVALHTIRLVGVSPERMVLGFMVATSVLSMWVSNTATTMMMVPIGMAVIQQATGSSADPEDRSPGAQFGRCLMLGIAYAASIGGVATIIGTPPNSVMVAMVAKLYGVEIGFAQWMKLGVPLAAIMIVVAWQLLTRVLFPVRGLTLAGGPQIIADELAALGPMSRQEKLVLAVGGSTALLWISRGLIAETSWMQELWPRFGHVHDATIAIVCGLALFIIPVDLRKGEYLLDWKSAVKIPWGVILLFGGGLAIANGFAETGLAGYFAAQFGALKGMSLLIFIPTVVLLAMLLTEMTSNTATATLLAPIMGSAAVAMKIHPFATIVAACVASSFAFMLPVATPPNAVVFGSGWLSIKQMAKAGLLVNVIGAVLIVLLVTCLMPLVWDIDIHSLPAWAVGR